MTVEVALGTREGSSVRGGGLGGLHDGALADAATVDKVIDAAVAAVGARQGVAGVAAVGGRRRRWRGGLRRARRVRRAGHRPQRRAGLGGPPDPGPARPRTAPVSAPEASTDAELIDLVTAELGSDWPRLVAPVFDGRKAVLFDDRWASAREDLAKLWLMDEGEIDADWPRLSERFEGAGHVVGTQATWWQGKALAAGRNVHASLYGRAAAGAENPGKGRYTDEVAVVTGASKGSIAASVVAQSARRRCDGHRDDVQARRRPAGVLPHLYRDNARFGAKLWVVPANMASYTDIDALVSWVGNEQTESLGPQSIHLKDAQTPTLLFPFAAPRVAGDLSDAGSRSEMEMKVLLWAVQRLIGGLSHIGAERDIAARLHVVLPGSPNRGMFGGDGAYGESKSALDALVTRWKAESSWAQRVSLAHALIGWTKGTGLMGHNDAIVGAVEEAGVTTYSTDEMATMLLDLCDIESKVAAAREPLQADLTGGLGRRRPRHVRAGRQGPRGDDAPRGRRGRREEHGTIRALPSPPRGYQPGAAAGVGRPRRRPGRPGGDRRRRRARAVRLVADPLRDGGRQRTVGGRRARAGLDHRPGQVGGRSRRRAGTTPRPATWSTRASWWSATTTRSWSGSASASSSTTARSTPITPRRCWFRCSWTRTSRFVVSSEADARAFVEFDPEHTVVAPVPDSSDWQVTRKAGTEIRVPRKTKLSRTVGAQIPTGFDPTVYGISPDMATSIDRVALWNIVATVDAFLSAGFTPTELMRWVHPSLVASTQGTGMGGMTSMQTMYHGNLLGRNKPNDILQEVLPNVVAGHVVQSYVGSYGSMIHPVGACATAAVSVEEGVDKIRLGKAEFVVAGGLRRPDAGGDHRIR